MQNKFPAFISIIGFFILLAIACKHTPEEIAKPIVPIDTTTVCDSVHVTFNGTVNPILQAKCVVCHNSTTTGGNIDFTKYADIARIAENGHLMGAIEHKSGYSAMPKNGNKLSVCDIALIRKWIADTTFTIPSGGIPCNPDTVYFNMDLLPILISSCAKSTCHDVVTHKEGIILTDYNHVMQTGGVNPFNPGGSKLYQIITNNSGENFMPPPPDAPLTTNQIQMVYKWIAQGAKNLHCDNMPCDTVTITYTATIWPIIQDNCKGCHTGTLAGGGIQLVDYATISAAAGPTGRLYGAITHASGFSPMPQNGVMLPDCYITQIRKWITAGMPSK